MGLPSEEISTGALAALIKAKARKFAMLNHLKHHDREDLAQDLFLHALQRADRFDASRGSAGAFLAKLTSRKLGHIHEARIAQKRDTRRTQGLGHQDRIRDPRHDDADLRLDVNATLDSLPDSERALAAALKVHRLAEAARITGVSRTRSRLQLARIRNHFSREGIKKNFRLTTIERGASVSIS